MNEATGLESLRPTSKLLAFLELCLWKGFSFLQEEPLETLPVSLILIAVAMEEREIAKLPWMDNLSSSLSSYPGEGST